MSVTRSLPHVVNKPGDRALRHFDDNRASLGEIKETDDIRRRRICGQDAALADKVVVDNDVADLGAKSRLVRLLPIGYPDDRQCPDVGLRSALEIPLVVEFWIVSSVGYAPSKSSLPMRASIVSARHGWMTVESKATAASRCSIGFHGRYPSPTYTRSVRGARSVRHGRLRAPASFQSPAPSGPYMRSTM